MKNNYTDNVKHYARKLLFPTPKRLQKKQIHLNQQELDQVASSIKQYFYKDWEKKDEQTKNRYKNDLIGHRQRRLESDRCLIIPWLDNARQLTDMQILEIGCGTGSSGVSLAEQGAVVTGIDVNEGALQVARTRAGLYKLDIEFKNLNADKLDEAFVGQKFDMVIFFASLEHMTIAERLKSLKDAWALLNKGGLLVIVETPNRLWYFDSHTSMLPFYHWLPNDLAFEYAKFSPRKNFNDIYKEYNDERENHFLRRGRGMSYHELDLAICPAQDLNVISSFSSYAKLRYKLKLTRQERIYRSFLRKAHPRLHEGFFDDTLYMIIQKP